MAFVYLLHFGRRYPGGQNPRHYLGVTRDLDQRISAHISGTSRACLVRACVEKGISIKLAAQWEFETSDEAFEHERVLKAKKKNYSAICPLCK